MESWKKGRRKADAEGGCVGWERCKVEEERLVELYVIVFFFPGKRRHTGGRGVSGAGRCVKEKEFLNSP